MSTTASQPDDARACAIRSRERLESSIPDGYAALLIYVYYLAGPYTFLSLAFIIIFVLLNYCICIDTSNWRAWIQMSTSSYWQENTQMATVGTLGGLLFNVALC